MVVVLPASMWATMPMFLTFDRSLFIGGVLYHKEEGRGGAGSGCSVSSRVTFVAFRA